MSNLRQLPKSRSSEEFELICKDILQNKYKIRFQIYGRNGQVQDGIDLFACVSELEDLYIVAQCKNYFKETQPSVLLNKIKVDIEAAKQQTNMRIQKFYLMTSYNRDVHVQQFIMNYENLPFKIEVLFWEDIQEIILSNQNLFENYYLDFMEDENSITLFNLAFIGVQFSYLIFLLLGTRTETDKYCELLKDGEIWIKNPDTRERFSSLLKSVYQFVNEDLSLETLCQDHRKNNVYFWCREIEDIVLIIRENLPKKERILFNIGLNLGNYSKLFSENEDKIISEESKNNFINLCKRWSFTKDQIQKIENLFKPMLLPNPKEILYSSLKEIVPFVIYEYIHDILIY